MRIDNTSDKNFVVIHQTKNVCSCCGAFINQDNLFQRFLLLTHGLNPKNLNPSLIRVKTQLRT